MALAAVDQNQVGDDAPGVPGEFLLLLGLGPGGGQAAEAAAEHFPHTGIVVDAIHRLYLEAAVVGRFGAAVLEHHHTADQAGALDVGDVVTLHALGGSGEAELFLKVGDGLVDNVGVVQPLDPGLGEALAGVFGHYVEEFLVLAALGIEELDGSAPALP